MEKWNFEQFCSFCLPEDVNISLEKVQFEMISQVLFISGTRFFKKAPTSEVQCTQWSFIMYLLNHISPLFSSATMTKLSYCTTDRFTTIGILRLDLNIDNTTDKTLQLNFTLKLSILILYSEMG